MVIAELKPTKILSMPFLRVVLGEIEMAATSRPQRLDDVMAVLTTGPGIPR